jgi:hypothetical protein
MDLELLLKLCALKNCPLPDDFDPLKSDQKTLIFNQVIAECSKRERCEHLEIATIKSKEKKLEKTLLGTVACKKKTKL